MIINILITIVILPIGMSQLGPLNASHPSWGNVILSIDCHATVSKTRVDVDLPHDDGEETDDRAHDPLGGHSTDGDRGDGSSHPTPASRERRESFVSTSSAGTVGGNGSELCGPGPLGGGRGGGRGGALSRVSVRSDAYSNTTIRPLLYSAVSTAAGGKRASTTGPNNAQSSLITDSSVQFSIASCTTRPTLIASPSGNYCAVVWPQTLLYVVLSVNILNTREESESQDAGLGPRGGLAGAYRSGDEKMFEVDRGRCLSFGWVGCDDTFAVLLPARRMKVASKRRSLLGGLFSKEGENLGVLAPPMLVHKKLNSGSARAIFSDVDVSQSEARFAQALHGGMGCSFPFLSSLTFLFRSLLTFLDHFHCILFTYPFFSLLSCYFRVLFK